MYYVHLRAFGQMQTKKFQTRSRERIGVVKNRSGFGGSFGRITVVLSQRLARLRTEELCSLFPFLFCNNGATRETTME